MSDPITPNLPRRSERIRDLKRHATDANVGRNKKQRLVETRPLILPSTISNCSIAPHGLPNLPYSDANQIQQLTESCLIQMAPPLFEGVIANYSYSEIDFIGNDLSEIFYGSKNNIPFQPETLDGKITLEDSKRRCCELRYTDFKYNNTPMHVLALYAPFEYIDDVFNYFKTKLNSEGKPIFFEKNQKNTFGLTAYDIARSRATTQYEIDIALKFFKFFNSNSIPTSTFGHRPPKWNHLNICMNVSRENSVKASAARICRLPYPKTLGLLIPEKNLISDRTCKAFKSINTDYSRFSKTTLFGLTQLKGNISEFTTPNDTWRWSEKKLTALNIKQLTLDLCSVAPFNQKKQLLQCIHDLLVLMIIIDDFNELDHPIVNDNHYQYLYCILDAGHDDTKFSSELERLDLQDYEYKSDPIYLELKSCVKLIDRLTSGALLWRVALKEHFESTVFEKKFIQTLSISYNHAPDSLLVDQTLIAYFNILGSRTIGINVIYQIMLAAQGGDDAKSPEIQELTLILAILARLSNDAQSGLKEMAAGFNHLDGATQTSLCKITLFQEPINETRRLLQTHLVELPPSYAITCAQEKNNSIEFGYFSLVSFYAELIQILQEKTNDLLTKAELSPAHRQALSAITRWTVNKDKSIISWSAKNLSRYSDFIKFSD
ncbi:MAG: terpene synthase family protein [Candidatus Margulisiibacteriota bacterium]